MDKPGQVQQHLWRLRRIQRGMKCMQKPLHMKERINADLRYAAFKFGISLSLSLPPSLVSSLNP
jgi:hypothetical protein